MHTLPFNQVDVFAGVTLRGNPLAVVHDADGLTVQQMQLFAHWTGLPETTFLLAPSTPEADYRVRIFTPRQELPFAGHPTLGSAFGWLRAHPERQARDPQGRDEELVQQCGAGLVRVRHGRGRFAFAAPPLVRSGDVDPGLLVELRDVLGLAREEVLDAQWVDNGPGWLALLVPDAATVLRVEPAPSVLAETTRVGLVGSYPAGHELDLEVRAFNPGPGRFGEDPVTGSLQAGIGTWLTATGRAPRAYRAAQGTAIGRRGLVEVDRDDDGRVWVGGAVTLVVEGTAHLP